MTEVTAGSMVCVVTTVKDTPANLDRFVAGNLAAGADHLFVFVDDADPATVAHLDGRPHVTAVPTGEAYWGEDRLASLNARQIVNANLANLLLAGVSEVGWLFHLDGDECLDVDRAELMAVPAELEVVRLRPLEAVSRPSWPGPVDRFKRPLDHGELSLLSVLGVIPRPAMEEYFNGHTVGKSGLRPSRELRLRIHTVEDAEGRRLEAYRSDALNVLHYESFSAEEFARKWMAHLSAGKTGYFRPRRDRIRAALATLVGLEHLPAERREELVREVHRRMVQDDEETLAELGLLVTPDPDRHRHEPLSFPDDVAAQLHDDLERLVAETDKRSLLLGGKRPAAGPPVAAPAPQDADAAAPVPPDADATAPAGQGADVASAPDGAGGADKR